MKISCQSCQAKYTIADEKVLGKIVKIRCKKCGATIVINGNESTDSATQAHAQAGGGVYDYTAQQGGEPWTVNVSDGDQRSMTIAELVNAFRSGVVNDETYCWKDGMADWLPLREIPELQAACSAGPQPTMSPDIEQRPPPDDQPTQAGFSSLFGGAMGGQQQQPQNGGASLFGGGAAAAAAPAAARRAGGRGGGGADLFGGAAQAGGEQDVMTSAAANPPPPAADGMTGARNENSVLFSLAALTSSAPEKKAPQPVGGSEGSGLIDIRALSASMEQKKDGGKKVDDIMNLSGGGAFSAALAAPVLAPAPADAHDFAPGAEPRKSNATLLIGIIAGFVILGVLIAGGVFLAMSGKSSQSTAASSTAPTATSVGSVAANDTAATTAAGTAPVATDTNAAGATGGTRPGVGTAGGNPGAVVHNAGGNPNPGGGGQNNAVVPPPTPHGGGGCAPGDLQCAMAQGAGQPAPPPATNNAASNAGPFNPGNASAAIGSVIGSISGCKRGDGPTGPGHAKITFQPSGTVSSVEIDSGPYPGTAVGGCIAGKLRGAHMPPFSGASVTVGKSFAL